jgi:hypothetical protein
MGREQVDDLGDILINNQYGTLYFCDFNKYPKISSRMKEKSPSLTSALQVPNDEWSPPQI